MRRPIDCEDAMYEYIKETICERGYAPSVRDIKTALNIKSTSTVHVHLASLVNKGLIIKDSSKSRTLRIAGMENIGKVVKVPIIGQVAAGMPIFAEESYEGVITVPTDNIKYDTANLFALNVKGTSMIDAGIMNGDVVIVSKQPNADNGEIVVALVDDEATVKTFYKENGHYRLQPENPTMAPIIVNEVTILGKVIASMRYYK